MLNEHGRFDGMLHRYRTGEVQQTLYCDAGHRITRTIFSGGGHDDDDDDDDDQPAIPDHGVARD